MNKQEVNYFVKSHHEMNHIYILPDGREANDLREVATILEIGRTTARRMVKNNLITKRELHSHDKHNTIQSK